MITLQMQELWEMMKQQNINPCARGGRRHKWRQRQPSQSKHSRIKERHEGSYSPKESWTENQPTPLHIAFKMLKLAHKQYEKLQE